MLLFHQNRFKGATHGGIPAKSCIPERMLPPFLDLIIWGHEHDCQVEPRQFAENQFIVQPGASVVTSLSRGEAGSKYCCVVEVQGSTFRSVPLEVPTRPFIFAEVSLAAKLPEEDLHDESAIHDLLAEEVRQAIETSKGFLHDRNVRFQTEQAELKRTFDVYHHWQVPQQQDVEPLIRLRVDTTTADGQEQCPTLANVRFGQQFVDSVANPEEILLFVRKKNSGMRRPAADLPSISFQSAAEDTRMELANLIFSTLGDGKLDVLPEHLLNEAVQEYVYRENIHSVTRAVDDNVARVRREMREQLQNGAASDASIIRERITQITAALRSQVDMTSSAFPENLVPSPAAPDKTVSPDNIPLGNVAAKPRTRSSPKRSPKKAVGVRKRRAAIDFIGLDEEEDRPAKRISLRR